MMLRYWYGRDGASLGASFFAETNSGGGGGGGESGGSPATITTPFDSLDLNEFDDDTKAALTKAREDHVATLQQAARDKQALEHQTNLARQFQSVADRNKVELEKLTSGTKQQNADPIATIVNTQLEQLGYTSEQITKIGPAWTQMLKQAGEVQKKQLGSELAPFAISVMGTEATNAFHAARSNDTLGIMQDPEIAEQVWKNVEDRVGKGLETNEAVVRNLARMVWAESLEAKAAKGETVELPTRHAASTTPNGMTPPTFTFPGSGNNGMTPAIQNVNSPQGGTPLNDDTKNALAATFASLRQVTGLSPKAFQPQKGRK